MLVRISLHLYMFKMEFTDQQQAFLKLTCAHLGVTSCCFLTGTTGAAEAESTLPPS